MKTIRSAARLALHKETLRTLSVTELRHAAGGSSSLNTTTDNCPTVPLKSLGVQCLGTLNKLKTTGVIGPVY